MTQISDSELAELRAKHPRGVKVLEAVPADATEDAPGDEFVFRVVDRAEYTRYRSLQRKALVGQGPADAQTLLARNLLLFPSITDFDALRERAPALRGLTGRAERCITKNTTSAASMRWPTRAPRRYYRAFSNRVSTASATYVAARTMIRGMA